MTHNILLIHDNPTDAKAVEETLGNAGKGVFQIEWVKSYAEGLKKLSTTEKQEKHKAGGIAAVLVDLSLPDSQGIETFDQIFKAAPHIPILVLVASRDEDIAKLAMQHGA